MIKQNTRKSNKKRKPSNITLVFLLLFSCFFFYVYSFGIAKATVSPPSLRIVYNNNPPFNFENSDGKAAGLLPDIWRLWAEKSDRQVEFIAAPVDQSLQMIQDGEADIHAGQYFSEDQDQFLDFSIPLFNLEYLVFVHYTVRNVYSLRDLRGFRIGVSKGFARNFMAKQLPDNAYTVYKDFPSLYEGAIRDEVRIFVSPQFNYAYYFNHNKNGEYQRFFPGFSAYNIDYLGAVAKGNQELLDEINKGMAKITPQERASIKHNWLMLRGKPLDEGILRISMSADYHPLTFLGDDGKSDGFLVDLWRLWSEKTGRDVTFIPSTWQESVDAVANDTADIHSGLMKNEERSQWLQFSEPIYGLSSRFYFLADGPAVQTLSDITDQQVGALKGTWQLTYLKKHLSKLAISAFDNSVTMVTALRQGRIELIFTEDLNMDKFLEHQRLRGQIYSSRKPVSMEPIFAGISKNNKALVEEINLGFSKISKSELMALEQRWIIDPSHRFYGTSEQNILLKLSDSEKEWLAEHQHIKLGGSKDWAPIDYVSPEGVQRGITADYLKLIEKRLEITFQVNSKPDWVEKLELVQSQQLDMIANIVKTEERSEFLQFSMPYLSIPYAMVSRKNDKLTIKGMQDLAQQTVVVEKDYYLHSQFVYQHPKIQLLVVDTTLQALEAVSSNKADAYIGNRAAISWLIEKPQLQDLKLSEVTGFAPNLLRFGVRKDWPEFVSIINKALGTITQDEHRAIRRKWLGVDEQNVKELFQYIKVTPIEQAWLDTLDPIRMGADANWPPLEFIDAKGKYSGMASDYMNRFSQQLGLKTALVEKLDWSSVLDKIRKKELDIAPMIVATPERSKYLNFTKPYIDFPLVVFTHRDNTNIVRMEDVHGKRLAIEKGYMTIEYMKREYPNIEILEVATTLEALEAVSYGHADAFIGNLLTGSYLIAHGGLNNVKVAAPTPYRSTLSIGVRKDWPLLIPLLNKAIDSLTETDRADIRHKWLTVRYDKRTDYSLILEILGVTAIVIMLMMWRNRELNRRKEQLEASEKQFKELINTLPIAIIVADYNGNIIFDNPQTGREFGDEKSLVGRNSKEFYASAEERTKILGMIADRKQVISEQVQYLTVSGKTIDCLLSVMPIRFDGQNVLLAVTVNVTERVKMEQALTRARKHAEESDHLKSAFLASMSHELRTPLNSIIGFTGILLQGLAGPLEQEQKKQLSMVQTSSRHLLELINDVLDISKIEAGELQISCDDFDVRQSIETVIQAVKPLAVKKGLALTLDVSSGVGRIKSDKRRVEQILFNLLGNGVKFTDSGAINVTCRIENDLLITDVKDTGSGIKSEDMGKLFQTFKQIDTGLDRVHEGTGLGLSISKKLVEKLGGDIQVSSEWGVGSTFTFRLPMNIKED